MKGFGCCLAIGSFVPQIDESINKQKSVAGELRESFGILSNNGYDFAELTVGALANLSEDEYDDVLQELRRSPIPVPIYNSFVPAAIPLAGPDVSQQSIEAYLDKSMHRVADAGGSTIIFGSGAARKAPKGFPIEAAMEQIQCFLHMCEIRANSLGITVAIEPLNKQETNIINSVAEAVELARTVGLPHIKVLADSYHMFVENESHDVISEAAPWLAHVHISDRDRIYPGKLAGESQTVAAGGGKAGGVDFKSFFGALKKVGYEGLISTECPFDDFEAETKESLVFIRDTWNS